MTRLTKTTLVAMAIIPILLLPASAFATNGKYVLFVFDDGPLGNYNYAKPVLDTYGYHASFMIVCNWVGAVNSPIPRMSWDQIANLASDGNDIESHTMTHPNLNTLSMAQLDFELNGSKNCLKQHGYNATAFSYPRGLGTDNSTVVNEVAKFYTLGKTFAPRGTMQFMSCEAYQQNPQTNCATYNNDGVIQWASGKTLRSHSIDTLEQLYNYNDTAVYNDYTSWLHSEAQYNAYGSINAIPIVALHEIVDPAIPSYWLHTNQVLFAHMIKYIHNQGYNVITLKDLGLNNKTQTVYIKGIQTPTQTINSVLTTNHFLWPMAAGNMTVSGKLTDSFGNPLANQMIKFTGNGAQHIHGVLTGSDGTFSSSGMAPSIKPLVKSWNEYQVNALYLGTSNITSAVSIQYFAVN